MDIEGIHKTPEKNLDPWIDDGNIVLAVEGKYFRVHRSTLSSYSEVFRDMFSCTQPTENELIEQCPVVHLHDAATDVQVVLKAMYDRSYPPPHYKKIPVDISVVAAFARLGEKYTIQQLVEEAKARLHCAFGPTLTEVAKISPHTVLFPGITGSDRYNFQVMNLLQALDLRTPFLLAVYQCVITCPLKVIFDGYEFNGSVRSLSPVIVRACILMKDVLDQFRLRLAQTSSVSTVCGIRLNCAHNLCRLWSDEVAIGQPFAPWRSEWDRLFCCACRVDLISSRTAAINTAWNQIPTTFGFKTWTS